jgi:hypothetical protein
LFRIVPFEQLAACLLSLRRDVAVTDAIVAAAAAAAAAATVFFLPPTSFYSLAGWNAPTHDPLADYIVNEGLFPQMASIFNGAGRLFAPVCSAVFGPPRRYFLICKSI